MDENDIQIIASQDTTRIKQILNNFLERNITQFEFPSLNNGTARVELWSALFQHLENASSESIHALCLTCVRILSRDKTDLENLICEKWINILMDRAGLSKCSANLNFADCRDKTDLENLICEKWINILLDRAGLYQLAIHDDEQLPFNEIPSKDVIIESLKCLCNLAFNSPVAQALCSHTYLAEGLVARLRICKDLPYKDEILMFDMKLLFILTALRHDIKNKVKNELHGMTYLMACLDEILREALPVENKETYIMQEGFVLPIFHHFISVTQQVIVCEILKTQFNLILKSSMDKSDEDEEEIFLRLVPILSNLLMCTTATKEKEVELHNNVSNLLTSVPESHYAAITPPVTNIGSPVPSYCQYEGKNMEALYILVALLHYKLNLTTTSQFENLSPILTVMLKSSHSCRVQRKYLRNIILPPLKDVSLPPEQGNTLRNQLCRLLTTPVTQVRDLAADFLFILCKEKVGRMVKYTGYGNAAGLLAQRGLLAGGQTGNYSSSSEDSDTEEYIAAQTSLDPVVGCTRPPRIDPLQGYSDEQKEYEAMKLVGLLEKLSTSGIVRPARVGEDGRPQPVEHLLELRDGPPQRPQS